MNEVFNPTTSACTEPVMKPNPAICNDDEIVPGEILAPPAPNPADAAEADVKNCKSVIC